MLSDICIPVQFYLWMGGCWEVSRPSCSKRGRCRTCSFTLCNAQPKGWLPALFYNHEKDTVFLNHKWIESCLERKRWLVIPDYNQFPPTPTLGNAAGELLSGQGSRPKEFRKMMWRFDFRLKCRVKSTFQSVDAKYELCACELDQNVKMYCNYVWWGGGPSIHAVAIT